MLQVRRAQRTKTDTPLAIGSLPRVGGGGECGGSTRAECAGTFRQAQRPVASNQEGVSSKRAMLPCSRGNMEPRNGATSKGASNKTSSRRNGSASGPLEVGRHIKQGATKATKQPGIWAKVVDFILVSCQMSTTLVCNGKYPKDSHGQPCFA